MRRLGAALALSALALPALAACPVVNRGQPLPWEASISEVPWPPWRQAADALTQTLRTTDVSRARVVFIGDSLTAGWHPQIFQMFFGNLSPLNLGVGGDATQGMLWRLQNGNWPAALRPELIVLMIGTNNLGFGSSPENVAIGVGQIIARLQGLAPNARILLLGIPPRGATAADPLRATVARTNALIAPCADNRRVFYADPGPLLLDGAGNLQDFVAFDQLHLSMVGYAIIGAIIQPAVRQLLQR